MEIGVHYSHLHRKELGGSTGYLGPVTAPAGSDLTSPLLQEQHLQFQKQLLQLKQQQELQQRLLMQHFQQQQQQLAEQHEQQLQERIKFSELYGPDVNMEAPPTLSRYLHSRRLKQEYLDQQKKMEEEQKIEKERRDKERLEQLKKKEKHEQSAIASSEVKQRLQEFVLNKKQREAAAASSGSPPNLRNWSRKHAASLDQSVLPSSSTVSPHCRHPGGGILGKYDSNDFPLRKTASEPNLKVRSVLKQKVIERRSSPLLRRKDRGPIPLKRRVPLTIDGSIKSSSPNSSPTGSALHSLQSSSGSTPIQEEPSNGEGAGQGDLAIYSSPSMPNISLGRPPVPSSSPGESGKVHSEAQVRAMATVRLGVPLTSHVLHSSLPFYPALPVIDGEFTPPTSPVYLHHQMKGLETGPPVYHHPSSVITDAHVAQARLHRSIHRPLGRTQSAPLPLGHPMLQQPLILSSHHLDSSSSHFGRDKHYDHKLLKQHIRQTVLTRAGGKSHVVTEEETEGPPSMSPPPEVIDLTENHRTTQESSPPVHKETPMDQKIAINEATCGYFSRSGRPLARALSSPLVTGDVGGSPHESPGPRHCFTTGLAYDSLMLKHQCICENNAHHPEHGGRLQSIWARLQETGLLARCERIRSRKATLEEIQTCHSEAYTLLFGTNPLNRQKLDLSKLAELPIKNFVMLPCGGVGVDSDTTWNELHTASAARMAAGCVVELALKVAQGEIKNGFAVVRPPGHHAETQQAMGFCFFNSLAIAAKQLRNKLNIQKILIVDWDVHHGNGLQQIFYSDPHVLYISLHRHDDGNFFPGTGDPQEVGEGEGLGYNVNIAWSGALNPPMGDAEYLTAFRTVLLPIAREFNPEVVLVAAGFDAAAGHPAPLGGYLLSPACFGQMTRHLMSLANGKVVLALEGGYDLASICDCSQACVSALLGDDPAPLSETELTRAPSSPAVETLHTTISIQGRYWESVKKWAHTAGLSLLEAQHTEKEEADTVSALASLSMAQPHVQSPEKVEPIGEEEPMEEDQEK